MQKDLADTKATDIRHHLHPMINARAQQVIGNDRHVEHVARQLVPVITQSLGQISTHQAVGDGRTIGVMGGVEFCVGESEPERPVSAERSPLKRSAAGCLSVGLVRQSTSYLHYSPPFSKRTNAWISLRHRPSIVTSNLPVKSICSWCRQKALVTARERRS
jgi:adenosylmethionine-8-amino-7-oxononanoate aminotransferase